MLSCSNVILPYGVQKISALNQAFLAGQRWAILGANGAGKSVLLSCLAGWLQPAAGQIQWELAASPNELVPSSPANAGTWAARTAYQPAQVIQPFAESLAQRLQLQQQASLRMGAKPPSAADVTALLQRFGLSALLDRDLSSASSGEQQRAWLASRLLQPAASLLLDEPLAHLDFQYQQALGEQLQSDPRLSLCVVHQPEWALRFCTHVLALPVQPGFLALTIDQLNGAVLEQIYGVPFTAARAADGKTHWVR